MGESVFSRTNYKSVTKKLLDEGPVTRKAEQMARETGKLNPLVDPSELGVIRRSLPRFKKRDDKLFQLTIGLPMPIETRLDTTGSMGDNIEIAIRALPDSFELCKQMLTEYDLQIAIGIFGDIGDNFIICRPQFEMTTEKIVEQLTLMIPEGRGGDTPEDPHYGLFGAAYLTDARIEKYGLKGYDFTISDAPARRNLINSQIIRVFGEKVFEIALENGHQINPNNNILTSDVVEDLLSRSHAFFLQVGRDTETTRFWEDLYGKDRVISLPSTRFIPHVQSVIIGLTEGVLALSEVANFLISNNVEKYYADTITQSVSKIPIGSQQTLRLRIGKDLPKKGDVFKSKLDLWPIDNIEEVKKAPKDDAKINWL